MACEYCLGKKALHHLQNEEFDEDIIITIDDGVLTVNIWKGNMNICTLETEIKKCPECGEDLTL